MTALVAEPTLGTACYRLGELTLSFNCDEPRWLACLERRYGAFRKRSRSGEFDIHYECTTSRLPEGVDSPLMVHVESPAIEATGNGFRGVTASTRCEVNLAARSAVVRGPLAMYPLDNLLRHLLPLLWERGAIFHAAALTSASKGILAAGPSGAGKSTLAQLAGGNALSDELAGVSASGAGFRLVSLPFWRSRPGALRLDRMFFLRHGRQHRLTSLSPAQALKRLASQTLWPTEFPEAMQRVFGRLVDLVESVPAFELSFVPRDDVWAFIEEHAR